MADYFLIRPVLIDVAVIQLDSGAVLVLGEQQDVEFAGVNSPGLNLPRGPMSQLHSTRRRDW